MAKEYISMPLDPQVEVILQEDAQSGRPAYDALSPAAARRQMLDLSPPVDPALSTTRVEDLEIPGPVEDIPIRLYCPDGAAPFPTVVYFHGGGWVIGDLDTHHAICHALAKTSGCLVVAVHYRLAPEHPCPAAIEDAYAATCWVADNADKLQADTGRLAVMGDSAGGTLATAVSMLARDKNGPSIRFQVLVYPVLDYNFETPSYRRNAEGYMITRKVMIWFWRHYLKDEKMAALPTVSPLRAKELRGLPPTLVLTAEFDPLCDEGEAYAQKLAAASVPVTLSCYEGMIHGFFRMTSRLDKAKEALTEVAAAIRMALLS
jgi:acetyl esterase